MTKRICLSSTDRDLLRQARVPHAKVTQSWWYIALPLAVSLVPAFIAWRALDFSERIRSEDTKMHEEDRAHAERDALLGTKLELFSSYANGSLATLKEFVNELVSKQHASSIMEHDGVRALFDSYVYDVCLGLEVTRYCVENLHSPTRGDLQTQIQLESEVNMLHNSELRLLEQMQLSSQGLLDSMRTLARSSLELQGDHVTVSPLPPTDMAPLMRHALSRAPKLPSGAEVPLAPPTEDTTTRFHFTTPDGQALTPESDFDEKEVFLGLFRVPVAGDYAVYRFVFGSKDSPVDLHVGPVGAFKRSELQPTPRIGAD